MLNQCVDQSVGQLINRMINSLINGTRTLPVYQFHYFHEKNDYNWNYIVSLKIELLR